MSGSQIDLTELLSAKPGLRTTEFWVHTITAGLSLLVGLNVIPDGLPERYSVWVQIAAFAITGVVTAAYGISRALTKLHQGQSLTSLVSQLLNSADPALDARRALGALQQVSASTGQTSAP